MYVNKPELAKEFEKETPKGKKLPKYAPKKKKKKKKAKSSVNYRNLIVKIAALKKEAMGAQDYLNQLSPSEKQLIATLPNKNNVQVAWAAVKTLETLKEYFSEVVASIKKQADPQSLVSKLVSIVKESVGDQINNFNNVVEHIAKALVQMAGSAASKKSTACILKRVENPKKPEDDEANTDVSISDSEKEQIKAFRVMMMKKLS